MADLSSVQTFSTPSFNVQPVVKVNPQQGGTTPLGMLEMIGAARQATALQKEQALLEPSIQQGIAQSKEAQLKYQRENFAIANSALSGLENSKSLKDGNIEAIKKEYEATHDWLKNMGVNGDGKYYEMGKEFLNNKDLDAYKNHLANLRNQAVNASTQFQANLPQLTSVGGQPALYNAAQGTVSPVAGIGQSNQNAPQAGPQTAPMANQPQAGANPPSKEPVSEISKPVQLTYPVRKAGEPFAAAPSEENDRTVGVAYKNGLIARQPQMATERRNLDETIKVARQLEESPWYAPTTGVAGAIHRKLATWAGDPTYIELSKNLANTTLSNMQALGLRTDQDKQLSSAANGDYTYPPEVLIKIANRAKADMTNIDMQATAAKNFSDKFGDNNMNAFKQMWSKNADTKVFEVINIAKDPDMTAQQKEKELDRLLGPKDSPARKEYNQKYLNLMKLTQTGTL